MTRHEPIGRRIRKDDGVELAAKRAPPKVDIGERSEWKLILLQQPPRPAFVDILHPRFVKTYPGGAKRPRAVWRTSLGACNSKPNSAAALSTTVLADFEVPITSDPAG